MKCVRRSLAFLIFTAVACITIAPCAGSDKSAKARHSAVTPAPRGGRWMQRHERFNERAKKGDVDLVFIGDSITQGWEGNGRKVWKKHYGLRKAMNLGIGGDRTQHVLWRLDNGNLRGITPKLAVIMIGTNNADSNTPQEIADGNQQIINRLRARLPKMKLLVLAIFPRGADENDRRRQVNSKTNELIAKMADGKMVHYLDIGKNFLEKDGKTLSRKVMPDLLHLNPKSYETWAASIEPKVAELLGEQK